MAIAQIDINGNPYIGVSCAANENLALVPTSVDDAIQKKIAETLDLEVLPITIAGSKLIGSLLVMNSNGVVVNNFIETGEILKLKEFMNVTIIEDKLNAVGNNVLTNDNGALVHKQITKTSLNQIEDALGVEVMKGTIAGLRTIGAAAVITNHGGLCHPKIKTEELQFLNDLFKIEVETGTANYGTPLVGACIIANSKGAVTGTTSTGIELGRMEDGFKL